MTRLALEEVRFGYDDRLVLSDVTFSVRPGELVALVGPNGSGKTTVLRLAAGFLSPSAGRVLLDGRPLSEVPRRLLARRVAGVAAREESEFPFTVRETVALGRHPWRGRFAPLTPRDLACVEESLSAADLGALAERPLTRLSTGERQRAAIARALAQDADVLLLDEPTAHLDLGHGLRVLDVLRGAAHARGKAVLAALHDLSSAALAADRVVLLAEGRVRADGPPRDVLTPEGIRAAFGAEVAVLSHPSTGVPVVAPTLPREAAP